MLSACWKDWEPSPQVYYLSKREWVRRQGDNYLEHEATGDNKKV